MLLPTGYYKIGGAIAVAVSFLLLIWAKETRLNSIAGWSSPLFRTGHEHPFWPSRVVFGLMCLLLVCGYFGSTDPLRNPLPLFVWTWWWVGFTVLQCFVGNLWQVLNPWRGILKSTRRLIGISQVPVRAPNTLGYLPAIVIFFGFGWFELIDLAPEDPKRLANVVLAYWFFTLCGCLLFGDRYWFKYAEPFSIFFHFIGGLSPFSKKRHGDDGEGVVSLAMPGRSLIELPALPISGVLFVILTLSTVSFDGFSKTFSWLGFIEVNPLEFPGRSAVVLDNTIGLLFSFVILAGLFFLTIFLGCKITDRSDLFRQACGRLIYSIIPISLVFHLAHYLTMLLTNSQHLLLAFNDPFNLEWNLLGAKEYLVTTSYLFHHELVSIIWISQTLVIVTGHIVGITLAHIIAVQLFGSSKAAGIHQLFLATLMVAYTVFGLWLLSTPAIS